MPGKATVLGSVLFSTLLLVLPQAALSSSLPKATQEMLKRLKLDPGILAGVDEELQVPQEWLEKARREGELRVRGTPGGARSDMAPFRERYPFVKLDFSGTNSQDRVVKTLMAYRAGRIIADVVESVDAALIEYRRADALEDLRSIPGLANVLEAAKDPDGLWVAYGVATSCMAYNKKLVRAGDLPKKWEDLLTNPAWRSGNLALGNRPGNWAVSLWKAKGEKWTKDFLSRLFTEVRPQLRKEGLNALVPLVAAGEFHAVIPASHSTTYRAVVEGAPVGLNCPEPAPSTLSELVIVKRTPNLHAARLYLNWVLSREGQLARQVEYSSSPVHKQLQIERFFPFAEEILGKERTFADLNFEQKVTPDLAAFWQNLWLHGAAAR